MKTLTDDQYNKLASFADRPIPLNQGAPDGSYVYDREYGYFNVGWGYHEIVMAFLYAFKNGFDSYVDMANAQNITFNAMSKLADEFIKQPGTCFFSSQCKTPTIWCPSNLNAIERRHLALYGIIAINSN